MRCHGWVCGQWSYCHGLTAALTPRPLPGGSALGTAGAATTADAAAATARRAQPDTMTPRVVMADTVGAPPIQGKGCAG
ncbi:hypothetical protein GCM10023340_42200 [Nocardioides marinquilinus]|uniref:Uncharacterized protein n=1 Tax=Nocardioides marinquilinus TaxID=1210400 RepID=A0ABP9Q2T8_9ACTN